jgi:starvation-inducible DNA-binding protein
VAPGYRSRTFAGCDAPGLLPAVIGYVTPMTQFTVPGLTEQQAAKTADLLQKQLSTYNDLHLTLKHVHWNVVGPNFIGVHEMIDPQVELVRGYADEVAERIATLGGSPQGTPGAILKDRTWDDYSVSRDTVQAHLAALDLVYNGVIDDTRKAIDQTEKLDPVTQDILIDHAAELEKFQWFVRAHLENSGGELITEGATTEKSAASKAKKS